MKPIALVHRPGMDTGPLAMWLQAAHLFGLPTTATTPTTLADQAPDHSAAILTGTHPWDDADTSAIRRFAMRGRLLVTGPMPDGLRDLFPGIRTAQVEPSLPRCLRISGTHLSPWQDGELLPFTDPTAAGVSDNVQITHCDETRCTVLATSHALGDIGTPGGGPSPALIKRGQVIYTPLSLGAIDRVRQPEIPDFTNYPYEIENHALLVFLKDLLAALCGDEPFEPSPLWPNGARSAVCVTGDVHDYQNIGLPHRADREYRDMIEYANILQERNLDGRATIFAGGAVAAAHPAEIATVVERGYEVCPHTYKDTCYDSAGLSLDEQSEDIQRAIDAFQAAVPGHVDSSKGFRTHGYNSNYDTRLALEALGYDYLADMQAWDPDDVDEGVHGLAHYLPLPQRASDGEGKQLHLLDVPDTVANDHFMYRVYKKAPEDALAYYKRQFDRIHRLGGLFLVCWHPYVSLSEGPGRDTTFKAAIEYMTGHSDVAVMKVNELVSWWATRAHMTQMGSTVS